MGGRQLGVDVLCDEAQGWVVEDEGARQLQAQAAADAVGELHRRQAVKAAGAHLITCAPPRHLLPWASLCCCRCDMKE